MGGFRNQSIALFTKNLVFYKRHLRSHLRLILFPVVLMILLGVIRFKARQKRMDTQSETNSTELTPVFLIANSTYRAVKTELMPFQDLPNKSCRENNGSCPVTVLVTGNNRTFVEGVAGNLFSNFTDSSNSTAAGVFVEEQTYDYEDLYYYLQSQCVNNFTIPISVLGEEIVSEAQCLEGIHLWRADYKVINNEIFEGYYNGSPKGEINEILAGW
ncbi:OLC1v1012663C1 [Oldenlandia corymbosa var. corymbosa]|uniref:OLC1v1012663C1 n=1 Tax=Oldenlandia corymbosa var. corymbosa TaxID=529605 RepID=A0AAV1DZN0_OLDCO|nr:OLC1v1012663C1 [Oldenlandia corymbosa var. corymbosa]